MSVEERLHAIAAQARQQNGDGILRTPDQLVPRLSALAPDLHAEIRALASALQVDAGARLASASDPSGEMNRIATDIAARERLSMAAVVPAVAVARRLGPLGAAPSSGAGGWAGDSVIAGGAYTPPPSPAPHPHYVPPQPMPAYAGGGGAPAPAAEPLWKNKWVLGGVGAVGAFFLYQNMQQPTQPIGPNPPPPIIPTSSGNPVPPPVPPNSSGGPVPVSSSGGPVPPAPPGGQGASPLLQPPSGQLPALSAQQGQDGRYSLSFSLQTQSGPLPGVLMLPAGGWDNGPAMIGFTRNPQSGQMDSIGGGTFQRVQGPRGPVRAAQMQWQQDNVGLGNICVAFMTDQQGQDTPLQGSTMCVMDGPCSQAAGCGRVQ